ncbi:response regulator [Bernardetia sp.]|uniref:response regulator n=1 Tax=Bernardetia sp. TaxID=1937974 RepID=UPI0025C2C62C|nr:response regulator [Bernardetia sp.]
MSKFNHVCVIDDDPIYTYLTDKVMKMVDFSNHIEFFKDGEDALNSLKPRLRSGRNVPEIIFLDLNMPIIDGWQFLDEIVKVNYKKKVIIYVVTSSIDPADTKRAESYSIVDKYVVKPITPEMLEELFADMNKN